MDLLNRVRTKLQGKSVQASEEELQTLAQKANRPITPVSPLEAGAIGAGPDSAKMAGSSANRGAAVRQAIQAASQMQPPEQVQQADMLSAPTTSLQSRVQDVIKKKLEEEAKKQNAPQPKPEALKTPAQQAAKDALARWARGEADSDDRVQLAQAFMNGSWMSDEQAEAALRPFLQTREEVAAQAAAAATGAIKPTNVQELAFTADELAALSEDLGMEPEELQGLTTKELEARIEAVQQGRFDELRRLQEVALSRFTGAAEREQALKQLRMAGVSGERLVQEQFRRLEQDAESALQLESLIQSDQMKALVRSAIDSETGMKALKEASPVLADLVSDNLEAFDTLTKTVKAQDSAFVQVQLDAQKLRDFGKDAAGVDMALEDSTYEALYGKGPKTAVPQEPKVLQDIRAAGVSPQARARVLDLFNWSASYAPEILKELKQLDLATLQRRGLLNEQNIQAFKRAYDTAQMLKRPVAELSEEELLTGLLGDENVPGLAEEVSKLAALVKTGMAPAGTEQILNTLDRNRDGKIDKPKDIVKILTEAGYTKTPSILNPVGMLDLRAALKRSLDSAGSAPDVARIAANYLMPGASQLQGPGLDRLAQDVREGAVSLAAASQIYQRGNMSSIARQRLYGHLGNLVQESLDRVPNLQNLGAAQLDALVQKEQDPILKRIMQERLAPLYARIKKTLEATEQELITQMDTAPYLFKQPR